MALRPTASPSVPPLPEIGHGPQLPSLLPHEMLLQNLGLRYAKLEKSRWLAHLMRQAQLACPLCGSSPDVVPLRETSPQETDTAHLRIDQRRGYIYLTSERLIFVPETRRVRPWTIFVARISMLRTLQDYQNVSYLVAYIDNMVLTIRFASKRAAKAILKVVGNIRLENLVRHHLVPGYASDASEVPPSYDASEDSLRRYFQDQDLDKGLSQNQTQNQNDDEMAERGAEFKRALATAARGAQTVHVGPHLGSGASAHVFIYESA